ncbi:5-(carboxyamino)imidazole ribonucleotide synthase [Methylovorus glucosotrophus]|uniref:N5-carboxyaminoimidazole ribonucleotide synthase n=1 Tax=Methylovorus glucosotrophus (strain SIP3-4) TaxID=582744 RepID=C6X9E5_METGS|nr:5-(carboxyamino)imidazole ribonucleotide synthase [Methylovorus glucosotrophus]ACT49765.1 phosphoribosylaminoimidazole carboxylase, ATPase subunit [Methylovorus glucosotrophus SIP3-4]
MSVKLAELSSKILPPAMLGMLGGGQLGRFFVIAAHEMGYRVTVLDPDLNSPAGKIADVHLCAAYDDREALESMAQSCVAITTEFENVPAETLEFFEQTRIVRPAAAAVATAQHRVKEKNFIRDAGLPVAPFHVIESAADFNSVDAAIYPAILKVARFGYDGKGQARVSGREEAEAAFEQFGGETCVLEKMLALDLEVSVVLARDVHGHVATFPVAENSHLNGILDISIAPARCSDALREKATALAIELAQKLEYVGVLGVEFFVCGDQILVNEIAPRPHNSGHYTLDGCVTNQFEQQVRVLTGHVLGDARLHSPSVMVNILGNIWHDGEPDWAAAFAVPALKLHLYGKHEPRAGRKMGHFTVVDVNADNAYGLAMQAREALGIGE